MSPPTDRPVILLTGCNGQVGWELVRTLAPLGVVRAVDVEDVDLLEIDQVRSLVREVAPALIVNPAAYTAVDRAESEPDLANAINATAPGVFAEEALTLGIPIIHYSTDYVFDGSKGAPYEEDDVPNPKTVYGVSKLGGEQAVQAVQGRHVILRLAWVFGMRGQNFVRTMLRLAEQQKEIRVVDDQLGSPTWSRMVAEASAIIAKRLLDGDDSLPSGVYHLPAGGSASWFEFAAKIFELAGPHFTWDCPVVTPITTADCPTLAERPAYSLLSGKRIEQHCGIELRCYPVKFRWVVYIFGK